MSTPSTLRLGVLSTARIARGFVSQLAAQRVQGGTRAQVTPIEVTGVASRDLNKAQAFANEFSIAQAFGSYEAMLASTQIDAVYIALPNGLHEEWTRKCLLAGKHVLCEKPLVRGATRARALFALAQERGLVLLEAFPYWFQDQTQVMLKLINEGAIGQVRSVQASFGFTIENPNDVRFDSSLDGGALMDAGCYALSLTRLIMGEAGTVDFAKAQWADAQLGGAGVDIAMNAQLSFCKARSAQIFCNMHGGVHRQAVIVGSHGVIMTDYQNHTNDRPGQLLLRRGASWSDQLVAQAFEPSGGFTAEAFTFAQLIHGQRHDLAFWQQASIDTAAMLDAILERSRGNSPSPS